MNIAVIEGRQTRPDLTVGICGEHGGDPASIAICEKLNLNYVSCSPYRCPWHGSPPPTPAWPRGMRIAEAAGTAAR